MIDMNMTIAGNILAIRICKVPCGQVFDEMFSGKNQYPRSFAA